MTKTKYRFFTESSTVFFAKASNDDGIALITTNHHVF